MTSALIIGCFLASTIWIGESLAQQSVSNLPVEAKCFETLLRTRYDAIMAECGQNYNDVVDLAVGRLNKHQNKSLEGAALAKVLVVSYAISSCAYRKLIDNCSHLGTRDTDKLLRMLYSVCRDEYHLVCQEFKRKGESVFVVEAASLLCTAQRSSEVVNDITQCVSYVNSNAELYNLLKMAVKDPTKYLRLSQKTLCIEDLATNHSAQSCVFVPTIRKCGERLSCQHLHIQAAKFCHNYFNSSSEHEPVTRPPLRDCGSIPVGNTISTSSYSNSEKFPLSSTISTSNNAYRNGLGLWWLCFWLWQLQLKTVEGA